MKTRNVYRLRLILEEEAQMKHPTEGWIKQPATERREVEHAASDLILDEEEGRRRYADAIAGRLLD